MPLPTPNASFQMAFLKCRCDTISLTTIHIGGPAMRTRRSLRLQRNAQSRTPASPTSSPSAPTIMSGTSFVMSRSHRPDVESAAHEGLALACMSISMPSPIIRTPRGATRRSARRTARGPAPPRHGPSMIFCGSTIGFAVACKKDSVHRYRAPSTRV
jgi:hypothetical protein